MVIITPAGGVGCCGSGDVVRTATPPSGIAGLAYRPLRVALIAPPWFEVPPAGYGGIEALCAELAQGLVDRGHEVTLIGAGRALTPAAFLATYAVPPSDRLGEPLPEVIHAARTARLLEDRQVDIVHDHSLAGPLLAGGRTVPTVVTAHGPAVGEVGAYYRVLFLGRMNPEKGADLAIAAARAADRRLILAAKCNEPAERAWFETVIRPQVGTGVEWIGEADGPTKKELLAKACCLLLPIRWEEPFGLVMVEAMACGTPVVALRRGSVPEVVADGVTGIICDDPAELPRAIGRAGELSPASCRRRARQRFDVAVLAAGYEGVYRELLDRVPSRSGLHPVLVQVPVEAGGRSRPA
jgi:glycosyltransferase involved in cell wall biosynthesis